MKIRTSVATHNLEVDTCCDLWRGKTHTHMLIDTLEIAMIRVTRQLKCCKTAARVSGKHKLIRVGELPTLTYKLKFCLVLVLSFVTGEGLQLRRWSERSWRLSTRLTSPLFMVSCGYISTIILCMYVNEQFVPIDLKEWCFGWLHIGLIVRCFGLTLSWFEVEFAYCTNPLQLILIYNVKFTLIQCNPWVDV